MKLISLPSFNPRLMARSVKKKGRNHFVSVCVINLTKLAPDPMDEAIEVLTGGSIFFFLIMTNEWHSI